MSAYCHYCGTQIDEDDIDYCDQCGPRGDGMITALHKENALKDALIKRVYDKINRMLAEEPAFDNTVDLVELASMIEEDECVPVSALASARPEASAGAREQAIHDFRMDELDAVMHSVDKWFEDDDPRLKQDPCNRAADAREIALKAIESLEAEVAQLRAKLATPAPEQGERALREPIRWFACEMERKLRANDDKGGWRGLLSVYLLRRLREEADELEDALFHEEDSEEIASEAADVANFAMMLADNSRALLARKPADPENPCADCANSVGPRPDAICDECEGDESERPSMWEPRKPADQRGPEVGE